MIKTANGSNLLGRTVVVAMGLVKRVDEIKGTFGAVVGLLKLKPVKIRLRDDAIPFSVTIARRVSAPLLYKVRTQLERMVKCGIIEEITEPTEWCVTMVPVPKEADKKVSYLK